MIISREEYDMLISKGNDCLDINHFDKARYYFNKAADSYPKPAEAFFGLMIAASSHRPCYWSYLCERYCKELYGVWSANEMNANYNLAKKYCKKGTELEKTLNRMDYLVKTYFELNMKYERIVCCHSSNYKWFLKMRDEFESITDPEIRKSETFKNLQFMWEFERPGVEWRFKKKQNQKVIYKLKRTQTNCKI